MRPPVFLALAAALAACQPPRQAPAASGQGRPTMPAERAYHAPPSVVSLAPQKSGRMVLSGTAAPGARVRLAMPSGGAVYALADSAGGWRLTLPAAPSLRLFGLSMVDAGRVLQAEGYLAVSPDGVGAQLRAGSGALVLDPGPPALRLLAVDFDSQGVAVVSGTARPGAVVSVRIDAAEMGRAAAGRAGRFSLAIDEPLRAGARIVEVAASGKASRREVSIVGAPPFAGPFTALSTQGFWRIDWTTPGGGRQTTILIGPARGEP